LIANYFKNLREKNQDYFVVEHYIGGAGELSSDFYAMLRRVMLEIKEKFEIADEIPTEHEEILNEFTLWLQKVKQKIVIILDGYNQIDDDIKERFLEFYLSAKYENVKLIVTAIKNNYKISNQQEIKKLTPQKKKEFVFKYLDIYGKRLTYDTEELLKNEMTDNTLFLRTLLEEIRLLGVYETIGEDITEYLTSKSVAELFIKIFRRYERDYDARLIKEVLSLLYISRDGLSENNLLEIMEQKFEVDRYKFYPMLLALEEHLVNRGGLYGFFHGYIRGAVKEYCLANDGLENLYRYELVDYFEKRDIDNQRIRELPYLLFELQDRDRLYVVLIDVEFFVVIQEMDEYELLQYFEFIDEKYPISDELTERLLKEDYNSQLINNIGYFFHLTYADYDNALLLFRKMMKLDREDSSIVINNYNNMGGLYATMGNYKRSFVMHKRALAKSISFFGNNHLDTAICYNSLGFVYESCEKFDKALEYYQKALEIREKILGENHPHTAILYNNIAGIYSILAEYQKALDLYNKALAITTKTLGKNHPENSTHYNNIAWIHYTMGEYEIALKEYNISLDISINAVGETHPSTLQSYDNLASCYLDMGRYKEALSLFKQTLINTKDIFGEEHFETAITMGNLATTYYNMEEYTKGIVLAKQALEISEKVLGKYSHTTATKYNNLALFYSALKEYNRALELYKVALEVSIKIRGDKHPDSAISYNNLAGVYESMKQYDLALPLYQKALQIYKDTFGENHPDTAMLYNNLAYLYESMGNLEKALNLYKRAYSIKIEFLELEHPDVMGVARNIELVREKMN
jgi:tetratricopeptide (TPR) repeat protein